VVLAIGALGVAGPASAQSSRPVGRVSFFTNSSTLTPSDGTSATSLRQVITTASVEQTGTEGTGLEFAINLRSSGFIAAPQGRPARLSIYDAYAGVRAGGGRVRARSGSMWLTDLGGLGSVAGLMVEVGQTPSKSPVGWFHAGGFYGVEPSPFDVGFAPGVRKFGGYGVLEGPHGRRTSVGYVRLQNSGLVERAVVTFSNFVPVATRVFLYQTGEYDLVGPAGQGRGGLAYFFLNGRVGVTKHVDLAGDYHRGRSIDTRAIADDVLSGRPILAGAIAGLLYESAGGRLTVEVLPRVRVNGGYTRDRNNRDSTATGRITAGASASDIGHTGLDLTLSVARTDQPTGRHGSDYVSVGRQFGRAVYFSGNYSTSLSVVTFTRSDGIAVQSRPFTRQIGGNAIVNIGRRVSLLLTAERTLDDTSREFRALTGITYRFR
jgi:hypothetical protein